MKYPLSLVLRGLVLTGLACSATSCYQAPPRYPADGNVFINENGRPRYGYQGTNSPAPESTPGQEKTRRPRDQGEDPEKLHEPSEQPNHASTPPVDPITPPVTPPSDPSPDKPTKPVAGSSLPFGTPVIGEKGYVYSPYAPAQGKVDVKDIPSGTKVECPYTKKIFRVP